MNPDKRWFRNPQLSMPPALSQQREIVAMLGGIDPKFPLHRRMRAVLEELFMVLRHEVMTGDIRAEDMDKSVGPGCRRFSGHDSRTRRAS